MGFGLSLQNDIPITQINLRLDFPFRATNIQFPLQLCSKALEKEIKWSYIVNCSNVIDHGCRYNLCLDFGMDHQWWAVWRIERSCLYSAMQLWVLENSSSQLIYYFQNEKGGRRKKCSKDQDMQFFAPILLAQQLLEEDRKTYICKLEVCDASSKARCKCGTK